MLHLMRKCAKIVELYSFDACSLTETQRKCKVLHKLQSILPTWHTIDHLVDSFVDSVRLPIYHILVVCFRSIILSSLLPSKRAITEESTTFVCRLSQQFDKSRTFMSSWFRIRFNWYIDYSKLIPNSESPIVADYSH
jgi:hypothetical protein